MVVVLDAMLAEIPNCGKLLNLFNDTESNLSHRHWNDSNICDISDKAGRRLCVVTVVESPC